MTEENIENLRKSSVEEIKEKVKKNPKYIHPCNKERQDDIKRLGFHSGYEYTCWLQQIGILKNPTDVNIDDEKKKFKNAGCKDRSEYKDKCSKNAGYENDADRQRERKYNRGICSPMSENIDCSYYIGTHIGERKIGRYVISILFGNIKQEMPPNYPGFDFLTDEGIKIDVKTKLLSVLRPQLKGWTFDIKYNNKTDYFLLIALNYDKENFEIINIWLIKKDDIVRKMKGHKYYDKKFWRRCSVTITERIESIEYFKRFSIIDKLDKKKLEELLEELS